MSKPTNNPLLPSLGNPTDNPFLASVALVLADHGFNKPRWPAELVTMWDAFVTSGEEGYQWDFSEYMDEMSVRDQLEVLLTSDKLQGFSEQQELRQVVEKIDARLAALFQPTVELPGRTHW